MSSFNTQFTKQFITKFTSQATNQATNQFTNQLTAAIGKPLFTGLSMLTLVVALAGTAGPSHAEMADKPSIAGTPFGIATQAYRGELANIPGYQSLVQDIGSGRITARQVITAAGATPTPELEREVTEFIQIYGGDRS